MGEKKRIAIATALAMRHDILALDEPSAYPFHVDGARKNTVN